MVLNGGSVEAIACPDYRFSDHKKYLVIGRNGAGKSTLPAILTGILKPDHGHLYEDGKEVCDNLLDAVSYLPQESIIFPTSCRNNVTVYGGLCL